MIAATANNAGRDHLGDRDMLPNSSSGPRAGPRASPCPGPRSDGSSATRHAVMAEGAGKPSTAERASPSIITGPSPHGFTPESSSRARLRSRSRGTTRYAPAVQPLRIALAQIAPRLGLLDENLARHRELIGEARGKGAGLVVFPELGLTGYLLQDLASEVAMRLDDPRLAALAAATADLSAIVSFVEESADHRLF